MTALLLSNGLWRYLAGAAALLGAYLWLTTAAYDRGRLHERSRWQAVAVQAAKAAAETARARAAQVTIAETRQARRTAAYAATATPITREVIRYVTTPAAAAACPDERGVQLGTAAIAAANAATAAAP